MSVPQPRVSDRRGPTHVHRPHPDSIRALRDLAHLIDDELDDALLLSAREHVARELGTAPLSLISRRSNHTELEYVIAGRAVQRQLEQHPACPVVGGEPGRAPEWVELSVGDAHELVPRSITAVFPAGTISSVALGLRLFEYPRLDTRTVEVIAPRGDVLTATGDIDRLMAEEWNLRNPYRGAVLEARAHPAKDLEVVCVPVPIDERARLVLPQEVWAAVDLNVHRHFQHLDLLKRSRLGANRGLLLTGPPGNGKTAICRALAHELAGDVTVTFADAATVRGEVDELYRLAASLAPCLVVMEDIDLIVRDRHESAPSHELVEFLLAIDGATTQHTGVVTIATTNDVRGIDPAARRAARFDRVVEVPPPGTPARAAILTEYVCPLGAEVDVHRLAQLTDGASGADLRELVRLGVLHHGADLSTERLVELVRDGAWRDEGGTGNYL